MRKNMHKPPKRSNFAIRKLTIGAAAVLLVGPLIGAGTQTVHASQSTTQIEQPLAQMHAQLITTNLNVMPKASDGIANLPEGATAEWIIKPDVTRPGRTTGLVLVSQWGHWSRTFTVPVDVSGEHLKKDNEKYDPEVHHNLSTKVKEPFAASTTVANLDQLPQGTNISWAIEPNWEKAGTYSARIKVTYPDKSVDTARFNVEVKEILLSENYQPQVKDLETTVGKGVSATDAVTNAAHLPEGTTITWKTKPDVSKAGSTTGTVLVTYKDHSTDEVAVKVQVNEEPKKPTDADRFELELRDLETTVGNKLAAEEAVKNKKDDWRIVWDKAPDFQTPGVYESTIKVFYPDGSYDEGTIKVTVNEEAKEPTDADRFELELRDLETTVGNKLNAEEAVKNKKDDWQIVWHTAPNFEKAGVYEAVITVFYPDGSFDEGTIKVTVNEAPKPEEDLEEVTDHTQHADLVKKVTRKIYVHHPAGDKEPIVQTATFTRTKFVNKTTGEFHHYTDWQAQNDTWEEFEPDKVAGHTHLIDGKAGDKVAAKKIDPNNEDHKDEVVHIHYQKLPVLPIDPVDPVDPNPDEPDSPDTPDVPEAPDTDKPSTTPDKDVNNGSTNSTHRPNLLPLPVTNSGSSQNTQNTSRPVGVSEPSSLSTDSSSAALGETLPQTGWGHVLAGVIITIWCVLFGLAIHENISSAKKREEE